MKKKRLAAICHVPGGPCNIPCSASVFPATLTANSWTFRFHVFLGLPLLRGPSPPDKAKECGLNTQSRTGLSFGRTAIRPNRHTCLYIRKSDDEFAAFASLQHGRIADAAII